MSTTTRILIGFLLVVAAAFTFLMRNLAERVERQYLEAAEEPMVDAAHILASFLEQEIDAGGAPGLAEFRAAFKAVDQRRFQARIYNLIKTSVRMDAYVTDAQGVVLFDSDGGKAEGEDYSRYRDVQLTLQGRYGARSTRTDEEDETSSVMFVGAPIRLRGDIIGVVSVSKPQTSMLAFIRETQNRIFVTGWSFLLGTMVAAVLVSGVLSSPIRKLTEYARAVQRGERVSVPKLSSPDLRTLGDALDGMRDTLEDRKYVESYVQTLTHEMKSPVAAIRGASELLEEEEMPASQRRRFLENIQTETTRLQTIIDRLLALSVIESRKHLEDPGDVNLADVVDEVCAAHGHALEARQLSLEKVYDDEANPVIKGEAFLIETAVGNLLQNAIEFSPVGGTVTVGIRRIETGDGAMIEVSVADEGPGIPEYARERVFERFYSLPHPSTGKKSSGLGLCFVREAAELHGGEAVLENREGGVGAISRVRFAG